MTTVIAYWNIRGLCEPIVLMLEYLGVKYERKKYLFEKDGKDCFDIWFEGEKQKMGSDLDFPNVPYLIDGDVKMTESFAIMRYLARKHGALLPLSEESLRKCDVAQGVIQDLRIGFINAVYYENVDFETVGRQNLLKANKEKLERFEEVFSAHQWLTVDQLTFIDFALFEYLDHLRLCFPSVLNDYVNVHKFWNDFTNLTNIKAYRSSERFKEFPVWTLSAKWGYGPKT